MIKYLQSLPSIYFLYAGVVLLAVIFFVWVIRYFRINGFKFNIGFLETNLERRDIKTGEPIQFITLEQLRDELKRGGQVNWIDRKITNIGQLRAYGRLVITGRMKLGKTREAIELIRRAEIEDLIDTKSIIKPSPIFPFITTKELIDVSGINPEKVLLLFLDDFPFHYSGKGLERLSGLLKSINICKDVFVVATARSDQLTDEHEKWLDNQKFFRVELPDLDKEQTGRLIDSGTGVFGLQIHDTARQIMVEGRDGTPELILMEMRRLHAQSITEVTEEAARRIAKETIAEAWADARRYIETQRPSTKYIFKALAAFYSTKVPPRAYFVLQHALYIWKSKENKIFPWIRLAKLKQSLKYLERFDISVSEKNVISHPDFVVEGTLSSSDAMSELSAFFLNHKRFVRKISIRLLYPYKAAHALSMYTLGDFARMSGQNDLAIKLLDSVLQFRRLDLYYGERSDIYYDLKNYDAALADLNKAIELEPDAFNYYKRSDLYFRLKNYKAALIDCDKAIKLEPSDAFYYFFRGDVYGDIADYERALVDYTKAVELKSDEPAYFNRRGNAYHALNNYEAALADYNKAVELEPDNVFYYNNRANIYYALNNYEAALADHNKVIELKPDNVVYYNNRGNTYYALNNYEAALADYNKVIELKPDDAVYCSNRGNTYYALKNYEAALGDYDKAIELKPDAAYYSNRGSIYYKLGKYAAALTDYNKAIELRPDSDIEVYMVSCLYAIQRNIQASCEWLKRAIGLNIKYKSLFETDKDFDLIREAPEFQAIMKS